MPSRPSNIDPGNIDPGNIVPGNVVPGHVAVHRVVHCVVAAGLDVAIVCAFVLIGRREHEEGAAASTVFTTAAPFLLGLAAGWLAARAWRRPLALQTGVAIWGATILVGMFTRKVLFDDGIAFAFIVVATLFLGAGLVGWRAIAGKRYGRAAA